jgi:hypothetical protein
MHMPRRPNKFIGEKVVLTAQLAAATDADSISYFKVVPAGRTFRLESAHVAVQAGIAENATNAILFSVKKDATIMASWNTDSDGAEPDNSIVADTPKAMTFSATDADLVAAGGAVIRAVADESGTMNPLFASIMITGTLY